MGLKLIISKMKGAVRGIGQNNSNIMLLYKINVALNPLCKLEYANWTSNVSYAGDNAQILYLTEKCKLQLWFFD